MNGPQEFSDTGPWASSSASSEYPKAEAVPAGPGRPWYRRWAWPIVQGLITLAVLGWVFADPAVLREMGRTLGRARPGWLVLGVALGGVWIGAGVVRWRMFLTVQGIEMSLGRAWGITLISMFFTLFLPGAMSADAVRIFYTIRHRPDRKAGAVLSVIMDHLAGMIALMAIALALTFSRRDWFTQSAVSAGTLYFLAGFFGVSVGGLVLAFLGVELGLTHTLPRHIPGREKIIEFADAFAQFLRRWRVALRATAVSFVISLGYFLTFYCAARAFGSRASLGDVMSIMPVVDVISALPLTVSGLGVREALFAQLLGTLAGVPRDVALLISLTGFSFSVVWSVIGGVVFPLYRGERGGAGPAVAAQPRA